MLAGPQIAFNAFTWNWYIYENVRCACACAWIAITVIALYYANNNTQRSIHKTHTNQINWEIFFKAAESWISIVSRLIRYDCCWIIFFIVVVVVAQSLYDFWRFVILTSFDWDGMEQNRTKLVLRTERETKIESAKRFNEGERQWERESERANEKKQDHTQNLATLRDYCLMNAKQNLKLDLPNLKSVCLHVSTMFYPDGINFHFYAPININFSIGSFVSGGFFFTRMKFAAMEKTPKWLSNLIASKWFAK